LAPVANVQLPLKQGNIGQEPLAARSRREIFRHISAVVLDVAPTWGDEDTAIVATSPLVTRADIQSVFDEITEKYHVAGINLRFDVQAGCPLRAILEPAGRADPQQRVLQPRARTPPAD
jgi:hypothetical protein